MNDDIPNYHCNPDGHHSKPPKPLNLITSVVLSGLRRQVKAAYDLANLLVQTDAFVDGPVKEGLKQSTIQLALALLEVDGAIRAAE